MKALKRTFLGIIIILAVAFAVALALIALNVIPKDYMQTFVNVVYDVPMNAVLLAVIGVAVFAMCLVVIFGRGGKKAAEKRASSATALIRASDIGAAYIAIPALDTMVQKNVRSHQRVKDCSSRVVPDNNCVAIHLRLALMPDTNVVEITETLQTDLKQYIESLTGIVVREIHILIDSFNANTHLRVD